MNLATLITRRRQSKPRRLAACGSNLQFTWLNFVRGINQQDSNGNPFPPSIPQILQIVNGGAADLGGTFTTTTGFYATLDSLGTTTISNSGDYFVAPLGALFLNIWSCISAVDSGYSGLVTGATINLANLTSFDSSLLTGLTVIDFGTNALTAVDLTGNPALLSISGPFNPIVAANIVGLANLTDLFLNDTQLPSIDLTGCNALFLINLKNNLFGQAAVDSVLVHLDTAGVLNGFIGIDGNVPPGAAGLAAKASLQGKGWFVLTD